MDSVRQVVIAVSAAATRVLEGVQPSLCASSRKARTAFSTSCACHVDESSRLPRGRVVKAAVMCMK